MIIVYSFFVQNYSSTSDEREERNHNMEHLVKHDYKMIAVHQSKLTVIDEDDLKFLNVAQDDTNNDQPRNSRNTVNLNFG